MPDRPGHTVTGMNVAGEDPEWRLPTVPPLASPQRVDNGEQARKCARTGPVGGRYATADWRAASGTDPAARL